MQIFYRELNQEVTEGNIWQAFSLPTRAALEWGTREHSFISATCIGGTGNLCGPPARGALVGAVSAATVGSSAGLVQSGLAVGSANVVGGVAERAASSDPNTKALDFEKTVTDGVAGALGGAAGAKVSKALEPVVHKVGGAFADNVTKAITPAAKGANQLGVDATVKAQSLAASGTRALVTTLTTTVLNKAAAQKDKIPPEKP